MVFRGGGLPERSTSASTLQLWVNDPCVANIIAAGTGRAQLALKTGALALGQPRQTL